jgi:DNA invertase Pin-like site-specific DNA recombinase
MSYRHPPKELPPGSQVIAYLRDSGGDRQELSIVQQKKEVREYCKKHHLILTELFEDAARSGTSTAKRDEFERMIDLCRHDSSIAGLLVWNFARFARNLNDAWYYKSDLRRRGIIVHSLTDEIPEGPYSQVVEVIIDIGNEEKSRQTSRDAKRGLAERTLAGYVPGGGTPPRGYRAVRDIISSHRDGSPRIGTRWEIDPETGPLVQLAFEMRAQGKSILEIMNSPCGVLYKTKGCWTTFFRNKSYLGIGKCGETEVQNHHPALVDRPTWGAVREVQDRIHRNKPGNVLHPRRYHSPSLLSGIAVCIHCGTPIIREVSGARKAKGGKWASYLCGKKRNAGKWSSCQGKQIQAAKADTAVVNAVLSLVLQNDYAMALIEQVRGELADDTDTQRQEDATRKALARCETAISGLLDTIETNNSAMAKERLKDREAERARLQFDLSVFASRRQAARLEISPEALAVTLAVWRGDIEAARDQGDIRRLQNLLRRYVTKIELGYEKARIWYTYPIDAFADQSRLNTTALRDRSSHNVFAAKALLIQWSKEDA